MTTATAHPCIYGPRYTVAIPYVTTGATQWHPVSSDRAPVVRGDFPEAEHAHAWARRNIPGCDYTVLRTDAPTSHAPTFPCVLVCYSVADSDGWGMSRHVVLPASPDEIPVEVAAALAMDGDPVFWPSNPTNPCATATDWGSIERGERGYSVEVDCGDPRVPRVTRVLTIGECTLCETPVDLAAAREVAVDAGHPRDGGLNEHLSWAEHRWIQGHAWERHGVMAADYFPGASTHGTRWQGCYTGVGSSDREACEDAIEQAASDGWAVPPSLAGEAASESDGDVTPGEDDDPDGDVNVYVVLYVASEPA